MGATFDLLSTDPGSPVCSRAGCKNTASWRINWRNPRIHAADRVKVWAACDEHRDFLADYLRSRAFPVEVTDVHQDVERLDDSADAGVRYGRASDVVADTASVSDMGAGAGWSEGGSAR